MKRRRCLDHKYLIRSAQFLILVGLMTGLLGVSYAAFSNILATGFQISTSNLGFIFDRDKNVVVHMQSSSDGSVRDISGKADYQDKKLIITGIGPIDMQDFVNGDTRITIEYAIKAEDEEHGIKLPDEANETCETGYDLGTVEMTRSSHTPVWKLKNESNCWGTESGAVEITPDIIYQYLPDVLGTFHVYNQLTPDSEDGIMTGTLLLKQESAPALPDTNEISLSSLGLPEEICNEIKSGSSVSSLEVNGTYSFIIPLYLDQFNMEQ